MVKNMGSVLPQAGIANYNFSASKSTFFQDRFVFPLSKSETAPFQLLHFQSAPSFRLKLSFCRSVPMACRMAIATIQHVGSLWAAARGTPGSALRAMTQSAEEGTRCACRPTACHCQRGSPGITPVLFCAESVSRAVVCTKSVLSSLWRKGLLGWCCAFARFLSPVSPRCLNWGCLSALKCGVYVTDFLCARHNSSSSFLS